MSIQGLDASICRRCSRTGQNGNLRHRDRTQGNYNSSGQNGVAEAKELSQAVRYFKVDVETIPDIGEDGRLVCAVIILGISILHYTDLRDRHQEAV